MATVAIYALLGLVVLFGVAFVVAILWSLVPRKGGGLRGRPGGDSGGWYDGGGSAG